MSKEKSLYSKPSFIYKAFITERIMANETIVSAANYGELPRNVKYIISNLKEQ